jgi:hypothetical protein
MELRNSEAVGFKVTKNLSIRTFMNDIDYSLYTVILTTVTDLGLFLLPVS